MNLIWIEYRKNSFHFGSFSFCLITAAGTPAFRKYFWANTSQATCDQVDGTSIPSCEKTTDPSGFRISLFASLNSISPYGPDSFVVNLRLICILISFYSLVSGDSLALQNPTLGFLGESSLNSNYRPLLRVSRSHPIRYP